MSRLARAWCWTLKHSSSTPAVAELIEIISKLNHHRYSVFQLEKAESGYLHYQGYTEFSSPCRLNHMKKVNSTMHVEPRMGSREQAREYCMKEDTRQEGPFEIGTWISGSGHRSDLQALKQTIDSGASETQIWDEHFGPMLKYHKAVDRYRSSRGGIRDSNPDVSLLIGATGTGKSHMAHEEAGEDAHVKPVGTKWFDFYTSQDAAILDEFSPESMSLPLLLSITDKWAPIVETKGGHVRFVAKKMWICTNIDPRTWYPSADPQQKEALYRRVTRWVVFTGFKQFHVIEGGEWSDRYERWCEVYDQYIRNR